MRDIIVFVNGRRLWFMLRYGTVQYSMCIIGAICDLDSGIFTLVVRCWGIDLGGTFSMIWKID
jgi:hypothetical protein